jgi:uncharacterized membrane protein YgcG
VLTLHELEHAVVLRTRDFEGVSAFAAAGLGHLCRQPRVAAAFADLPPAVLSSGVPPVVTAAEVVEHLAAAYDAHAEAAREAREAAAEESGKNEPKAAESGSSGGSKRSQKRAERATESDRERAANVSPGREFRASFTVDPMSFDLTAALNELAARKGLGDDASGAELCVRVRADALLKYVLNVSRSAARGAAYRAARGLEAARREAGLTARGVRAKTAAAAYEDLAALVRKANTPGAAMLELIDAALPELHAASAKWACTLPQALSAVALCALLNVPPESDAARVAMRTDAASLDALEAALLKEIAVRLGQLLGGYEDAPTINGRITAVLAEEDKPGVLWLMLALRDRMRRHMGGASPITLLDFLEARPALAEAVATAAAAVTPGMSVALVRGANVSGGASRRGGDAAADADAADADADANAADEAEVLSHVCDLLRAAADVAMAADGGSMGTTLLGVLAATEGRLLAERHVSSAGGSGGFEELGLGSFAAFAARHAPQLSAALPPQMQRIGIGSGGGGGGGDGAEGLQRESVLRVAAAVARSAAALTGGGRAAQQEEAEEEDGDARRSGGADADAGAIAAAVAAHFGIASAAELLAAGGFDSAEDLLAEARASAPQTAYALAAALVFSPASASASAPASAAAGPLGALSAADAARALARLPPLSDVASALHWRALFAPSLGPLPSALPRATAAAAASSADAPRPLLEVCAGVFVALPADASVAGFASALGARDASGAAAHVVGLADAAGHVSLTPLALLRAHAAAVFSSCASEDNAACLVRDALLATPAPLRAPLAAPVFLTPFFESAGAAAGARALLAAAAGAPRSEAAAMLHALGWQLGVREWVEALRETLFSSSQEGSPGAAHDATAAAAALPAPPGAAAGAAAAPSAAAAAAAALASPPSLAATSASAPGASAAPLAHADAAANAALCADIARGYGFVADAATGALTPENDRPDVRNLQRGYARATQRLAAELYANDIHFVLELVQNADDCSYETAGADGAAVTPTLRVALGADDVRFASNEKGFSEANVRALCSVGDSTKAPGAVGYIGQKGIGFKSVFKVSARPEVHSRGWHFGFDASDGGLGYILPRALPPPRGWAAAQGGTLIRLPLDAERSGNAGNAGGRDVRADLVRRLDDIHPSLLLFLNRLRCLEVVDATSGGARRMTRADAADGAVVTISDVRTRARTRSDDDDDDADDADDNEEDIVVSATTERWLRVSAVLAVPPHAARAGIGATQLSLALPLLRRSELAPSRGPLPDQEVFAYLPLRSYGFRFMLQGDWVVPSSREAVDTGAAWNQWLREEVPPLFEAAAREVVRRAAALAGAPDDAGDDAAADADEEAGDDVAEAALLMDTFFRVIPLRGSVLDFFAPTVAPILARLARVPLLPVSSGAFVTPPLAVLRPSDGAVAAAMAPHLARLGLSFVSRHVDVPIAVAAELGVRTCDASLVLELLAAAADAWAAAPEDNDKAHQPDFAWLAWALEVLGDAHAALGEALPRLARLRILPTDDGGLAAAADAGGVYELTGDDAASSASSSSASSDEPPAAALAALAAGARMLHPRFVREVAARGGGAARALARMGVTRVDGAAFFSERVLPALGAPATPPDALPALLRFARARWRATPPDPRREALAASLVAARPRVRCADGAVVPIEDAHLGAPYASAAMGTLAAAAGVRWPLVSAEYVSGGSGSGSDADAADAAAWAGFFSALGARRFAHVRRQSAAATSRRALRREARWEDALAAADAEKAENAADADADADAEDAEEDAALIVDDWASPELDSLLAHCAAAAPAPVGIAASRVLLSALSAAWDVDGLSARLRATAAAAENASASATSAPRAVLFEAPSAFVEALRAHAWLEGVPPASGNASDNDADPDATSAFTSASTSSSFSAVPATRLYAGGALFAPLRELRDLLGDALVPFFFEHRSSNAKDAKNAKDASASASASASAGVSPSLLAALGVRTEAPPALLLTLLEGLASGASASASASPSEPRRQQPRASVCVSLLVMARIYGALFAARAQLAPRLETCRWLFVPDHAPHRARALAAAGARRRPARYGNGGGGGYGGGNAAPANNEDAPVRGSFYAAADCVWSDESNLIDSLKPSVGDATAAVAGASRPPRVLCRYYEWVLPFGTILCEMGVRRAPSLEQYAALLREAASGRHDADASVLAAQRVFGGWAFGGSGLGGMSGWADALAPLMGQSADGDADADPLLIGTSADEDDWGIAAASTSASEAAASSENGGVVQRSAFGARLIAALRGAAVVPTAGGGWAPLESMLFLDDALAPRGSVLTPWGDAYRLSAPLLARCVSMRVPSTGAPLAPAAQEKLVRFYCVVMGLRPLSAAAQERCADDADADADADGGAFLEGAACRELVVAAAVLQRWSGAALGAAHDGGAARAALRERVAASRARRHAAAPLRRVLQLCSPAETLSQPLDDDDAGGGAASAATRVFMDAAATPPTLHICATDDALSAAVPHVDVALALSKLLGGAASAAQRTAAAALLADALRAAERVPAAALRLTLAELLNRRLPLPLPAAATADATAQEEEEPWLPFDRLVDAAADADADVAADAAPRDDEGLALALAAARAAADDAADAAQLLSSSASGGVGDAAATGPDAALALAMARMPRGGLSERASARGTGFGGGMPGSGGGGGGSGAWMPAPPLRVGTASASIEEWDAPAEGSDAAARLPPLPPLANEDSEEDDLDAARAVGRWGEAYVAALLRAEAPDGCAVRWVNEAAESGRPYDVQIVDSETGVVQSYVEVKTTVRGDDAAGAARRFEMSLRELEAARQHGGAYAVYRVALITEAAVGADADGGATKGRRGVRVLRLRDPAAALASGALRLMVQL